MLYRFFLTDFFFLYKQGKNNRERILVRRYLEIVIRLSNIGTKLDNNESNEENDLRSCETLE